MAEVHVLPGVERRDLLGALPCEQLLQKAIDLGITDVVIVGRDRTGNQYVASALPNADVAVGRLFSAANYLASSIISNDQVLNTEDGPIA